MPRFLAVYTMKPENIVRFRSLPKAEQDAVDAAGIKQSIFPGDGVDIMPFVTAPDAGP